MSKKNRPKFIRKNGRIIPIGVQKEMRAAGDIASSKNAGAIAQIGGVVAASMATVYGSGRLHRYAKSTGNMKLNRVAKLGKFAAAFGAGIGIKNALTKIDKRTNDEQGRLLQIGSQAKTGLGVAASFASGYALYRVGKRFEYAGKLGKNLFKKKDIKSMLKLDAI